MKPVDGNIIEMHRKMEKDYLNRTQLYGCYTYVSQIKKGMKHKDLLPVVIISIIGAKALPDELPYISYHHIKESNNHKQYLFSLTYVFIELGKFKKMVAFIKICFVRTRTATRD